MKRTDTPVLDDLPENLDEYLNGIESRVAGITPNTEKKIFWYSKPSLVTPRSIIYIHGYSASRQEVSPLVENLASRLQCNLYFTRLTGHGLDGQAMTEITLQKL